MGSSETPPPPWLGLFVEVPLISSPSKLCFSPLKPESPSRWPCWTGAKPSRCLSLFLSLNQPRPISFLGGSQTPAASTGQGWGKALEGSPVDGGWRAGRGFQPVLTFCYGEWLFPALEGSVTLQSPASALTLQAFPWPPRELGPPSPLSSSPLLARGVLPSGPFRRSA